MIDKCSIEGGEVPNIVHINCQIVRETDASSDTIMLVVLPSSPPGYDGTIHNYIEMVSVTFIVLHDSL